MKDYELALEIATRAHRGQIDRAGSPYIEHPLAVAELVKGPKEKIVALLHDVVEDTPFTLESIAALFDQDIVEGVRLMTHEEGVPYFDYIQNIKPNALARSVKLADLAHNSDLSRLPSISDEDRIRLAKYAKARQILEDAEALQ